MTTLNGLQHKVTNMIDQVAARLPRQDEGHTIIFDMHLFSKDEQAQLQALLATLPDPLYLRELTDMQLYQVGCWIYLESALVNHDDQAAAYQRERINTTDEVLLQAFLSLDTDRLPADYNDPGISEQGGHCIYFYSRRQHQHLTSMSKRAGQDSIREDLWRWVHFYRQRGW